MYIHHPLHKIVNFEKELIRKKWIQQYFYKENVPVKQLSVMFDMPVEKVEEIINEKPL